MAASNAELLERAKLDPESVDIERPSGSEKEQVIAMVSRSSTSEIMCAS